MTEDEGPLNTTTSTKAVISRTLPFALFITLIAVGEACRFLAGHGCLDLEPTSLYYLYPVQTVSVAALLYLFRGDYHELSWRDLADFRITAAIAMTGLVTCALWVRMDWILPLASPSPGFNPLLFPEGAVRLCMTIIRVMGSVLVVPLMEELFWRSFLPRYLDAPRFESVPIGSFTRLSFLATALLFGLEHHFIAAGIVAGIIFNTVLYKTRSMAQCVLAHSVTNLALAAYVLYTRSWHFW